MKIIGIIPARMAATRFPNKPMAPIQGIPMIGHCYIRSKMCALMDEVYVATCDQAIYDYIHSIGGKAVMTSDVHERATERTAEALLNIEAGLKDVTYDVVVMIQGDEPLVDPDMLREAAEPLLAGDRKVSNLMAYLPTQEERESPNNVKVVTDIHGDALYFSREPIPSRLKYKKEIKAYRQLGLIAFSRWALQKFVALETTPLEQIESVDMNRFLEHRIPIHMEVTKYLADSVDTPEDLARVEEKMKSDPLFQSYKSAK
ncbi:MAG TPA: 3-deoxy-manno-octulosonate cytidylyltransferase [Dinghuibacter sp.]|jgi:3-deoxy-manno-octulosonate cytidylyltransferase (CMP-KDO synthetase)|uniref:3-deoxy-manno-octulosonate cytidylyltransferase n=1 Tax=Dinghuibacter sp. TaxID=2024697 RepID=UPI002BD48EBD|nr:3-deoxy-manno-octulosonate cytidylyltransferase [Dinghuibacter sp.]HTJ10958.1 3-deoxy-manno-octulosonate cytidylyltransferase [Dinghuibacter sp.]